MYGFKRPLCSPTIIVSYTNNFVSIFIDKFIDNFNTAGTRRNEDTVTQKLIKANLPNFCNAWYTWSRLIIQTVITALINTL